MQTTLLGFFLVLTTPAAAQMADSLHLVVGTTATAATRGYQPLWAVANRYGTIADRQTDAATFVAFRNEHALGKPRALPAVNTAGRRGFYVGYGAALYNI